MKIARAIVQGLKRMTECSGLVVAMWLIVLLVAVPFAAIVETSIREDVGASRMHEELRSGVDLGWLEEFHHRGGDLARTVHPVRLSPAMVFANLDLWLSGEWLTENRVLAAAAGLFLVAWILAQGGILTQLASPDLRFAWSSFLAGGGTYFFRFLRLALMAGVAYYGVYRLAYWLFPALDRSTRDVTSETRVLLLHLAGLGVVGLLMSAVHLVADFARIATVRDKRRSMVLAIVRSIGQVGRRPLQALGVFCVMTLMLGLLQVLYYWLAPGVAGSTPASLILALIVGQMYLFFRWALRIARYGAEMALYDSWTVPSRRQNVARTPHS